MIFRCLNNQYWRKVYELQDELVWVEGFDLEPLKGLLGEIIQIASDDDAGFRVDGCCQHMAIPLVRQDEGRDEVLIPGNEGIRCSLLHELPRAFQLFAGQVWSVFEETTDPFFMHVLRPLRSENAYEGKVHEEVAKLRWVKHVCVIKDDESCHESDPDFLVISDQLCKSRPTLRVDTALVRHQRFEANPTMCANFAVFDLCRIQKLNEGGARDVQHIRRFLSREFRMDWNQGDGVAQCHLFQNPNQHLDCRSRNP
jgi:hypothetical protein